MYSGQQSTGMQARCKSDHVRNMRMNTVHVSRNPTENSHGISRGQALVREGIRGKVNAERRKKRGC